MARAEAALDSALLTTKIFQACCEAPGLHFLKPAAALAVIICESAKTVTRNADTAKALSERTTEVLNLVVDHLRQIVLTEVTPDLERDAVMLYKTLEKVNQYVKILKGPKQKRWARVKARVWAWVWALKDKEDLDTLNKQLDEVLIIFGISRTLAVSRKVAQVQDTIQQTHQSVKLVLSRVDNTLPLPRTDEPRVIHGDYICRESELSKYTDLLLTPNMGERNTVVAIRLHKATYKEPYGDLLPIIALDYDSKTTEQAFVDMCKRYQTMRTPYFAQVCGVSNSQHTLYFFSTTDCLPMNQVIAQATEEEFKRYLSWLGDAVKNVVEYLWEDPVSVLIPPEICVIQGDKVVLMDIPALIRSNHRRVHEDRIVNDLEVVLGDNSNQHLTIQCDD